MKPINLIYALIAIFLSASIVSTTGLDFSTSLMGVTGASVVWHVLKNTTQFVGASYVLLCGEINGNIANNCTAPIQAGTRDRCWVINFDDVVSVTYAADETTITDIVLASGAVAYYIDGQKNSISPASRMVVKTFRNMYDHEVTAKGFDISPATKVIINSITNGRFIVITENFYRGTAGNSAFEVYGIANGMTMAEIERDPNSEETDGAFHMKFMTDVNKEPKTANTLFITDYATTKAVVDALLV